MHVVIEKVRAGGQASSDPSPQITVSTRKIPASTKTLFFTKTVEPKKSDIPLGQMEKVKFNKPSGDPSKYDRSNFDNDIGTNGWEERI